MCSSPPIVFVVRRLLHFNILLQNHKCQWQPNLVGIFIMWSSTKLMCFSCRYSKKKASTETRGSIVTQNLVFFLWNIYFSNNVDDYIFLLLNIQLSLFVMSLNRFVYGSHSFQDIRGSKWGQTP
jgi:hypothetical protein